MAYRSPFGDTTFTKVFVGGLAWETPVAEMRAHFQQFGHILEAVIISDKITGKSKGYGFVTYEDAESAKRACNDPNPIIDGRRANCNIASFGGRNGTTSGQVASPSLPPPSPSPSPSSSLIYPPYGYAAYPVEYAYHQGMYNPAMQHAYHHQMYGPTSPTPYYYGYSYSYSYSPRGTFHPSYAYYPTPPSPPLLALPPRHSSPGSKTALNKSQETETDDGAGAGAGAGN